MSVPSRTVANIRKKMICAVFFIDDESKAYLCRFVSQRIMEIHFYFAK